MRKVKSRNFILMVCGVLITLLFSFVFAKTIIELIDEVDNKDISEEIQRNLLSSSSKVKLYGTGNFVESTPKVEKTSILDFSVQLDSVGDGVYYSIGFCNMNNKDLKYEDLDIKTVLCNNSYNCNNVFIDTYVKRRNKRISEGDIISANSCFDVVIDIKCIDNLYLSTQVNIDKVQLKLVNADK